MKKIYFPVILILLFLLAVGVVFANNFSTSISYERENTLQYLQNAVELQCKDLSDFNCIFIETGDNQCVAKYGNSNIKLQPSSLFKYITLGIALNENSVKTDDIFECTGNYETSDFTFWCYEKQGHGKMSFSEAVHKLCPLSYVNLASKINNSTFYDYLKQLNFSELKNYNTAEFSEHDKIKTAMGQGIHVTPEELLSAYSKIFNAKKVFSEQCVDELLNCVEMESSDNGSTILFDGVCTTASEYFPAVISIATIDEKQVLGMSFSKNLDKNGVRDIVKKIFIETKY